MDKKDGVWCPYQGKKALTFQAHNIEVFTD